MYLLDVMCRIIPDLEMAKFITPFYYCNAADIFSQSELEVACVWIGVIVTGVACPVAVAIYRKRDMKG